ncbi:putative NRPS-like protein biosynthetic cluster [Trichoderma atroviride]|uniref:putative NRPS-like protein biosynthetic cluster n=1 Tax=Hypocrea atroviridis TaxID=63577 RepID=UPI00332CE16A|nr:putative NRPS-like protein biosynthetic cluster [Trichoderma atroviride]
MPGILNQTPTPEYGRRLIPNVIDERAESDPTKAFASIPRSKDLADGFVDITYALVANAINRASWWLSHSMGNTETSEVFAYFGPNDLRYPILLVATMKCGYQMMMPSPRNSAEYQQELLRRAGCQTLFCTRGLMAKLSPVVDDLDIFCKIAPDLDELLDPTPVAPFPYEATYDEVKKNPFLILHTSGSTGPPKPITLTIECTTTEDTHRLLDDPEGRLWWRLFANRRYFMGMPCYHSAGVWFSLFKPVFFNSTAVFALSDKPLTASIAEAVHRTAEVSGGIYPPSVLEEISRTESLSGVKGLEFVAYGGGPLSKSAGDRLSSITILHNFIGFTENSAPPRYVMEPEDWNYFEFHPASGYFPEHLHDDLYRMSFKRLPEYEFVQTVFRLFPELDKYTSGDILSPHPTKPNLWTYGGRTDDLIVLSTGEKFNPIPAELMLKGCSVVKDTLIVGDGRSQAALLVECDEEATAGMPQEEVLNELWPFVQRVNQTLPTQGRLLKTNIVFASAEKEFSRSPKGSVQRKATVANFEPELNSLYAGSKSLPNGNGHNQLTKKSLSNGNSQDQLTKRTLSNGNGHNQLTKKSLPNGNSHNQLPELNGYSHGTRLGLKIDPVAKSPSQSSNSDTSSAVTTPVSPRTVKLATELNIDDTTTVSTTTVSQHQEHLLAKENVDKKQKPTTMVSESQAISFIRKALEAICGIRSKNNNDDLFELGLDSVMALQLSNELQRISPLWPQERDASLQLIYANSTIKSLAQAINQLNELSDNATDSSHSKEVKVVSVAKEVVKEVATPKRLDVVESQPPNTIEKLIQTYTSNLEESAPKREITVALTGSTGAVGSHLLNRLMAEPNVTKIFCLNRSTDGEKAQRAACEKNDIKWASGSKPVEFLTVDLSQPHLGLKSNQYAALQDETDIIIHNAWKLDFLHTVQHFEKTHIAGVRHLVDLSANSERRPRIVFISSIASVLGWKESRKIPEEIILSDSVTANNGYAQSKHIAERILYEASQTVGIQITVVRLGQIAGPTSAGAGKWNSLDWVPQIIYTSKSLGAVPKTLGMADDVDWVPIDRLPDILVDLIHHDLKKPERFQIYHAANPNPVSWGSLLPAICHRLGPDVELVTYQQWLTMLRNKSGHTEDVKDFPALRLMGWLRQMDAPMGVKLPSLSTDVIAQSSSTFSTLESVRGTWMENWMESWGL